MKKVIGIAVVGAAIAATGGVAHADGFSASVNLASDYVFRGLSQTDGGAAIQGSLDYQSSADSGVQYYAGVWGSNVNFGATSPTETASLELDTYAGIHPHTGPITWDLGVIGYFFPNADRQLFNGHDLSYGEVTVGANMKLIKNFTLGAQVAYSPNFFSGLGVGWYEEINGRYDLSDDFSLNAGYGHQEVQDLGHYNTWNFGATYALQGFQLGVNYSDTSSSAFNDGFVFDKTNSNGRVAVTLGRQL
jgi:uncharacterized protein (TIGR02001 family)